MCTFSIFLCRRMGFQVLNTKLLLEYNNFLLYYVLHMEARRRKILVVDDNVEFVDLVKGFLESKNYQISIALDGEEAIRKAKSETPEVVLLDLRLPDLPGEEVLERLREIDKDIVVIVITGYGREQVAVDMMRKGAIDFLSKPTENEVLLKSIKNSLEIRDAQIEDRRFKQYPSFERFFPFLAHEIRNPLHAIAGALAIIRRHSDLKDELLAQSIKIIEEEVQHLNGFVQECLNFVRPPNLVRFSEVQINEVISVVLNIITNMFERESKKIRIIENLDPHLPSVYANYEQIKQAFTNIVKNAIEAMPEGGELSIKTHRKLDLPKYIEIVFIDSGIGIKKENMKYLFNPFFTTKLRGTGLGLAICRRIIFAKHHGKIHIDSEENKGTTIKVELPIGQQLKDIIKSKQ
jgi:two-component system sensor histidine kinase/response regulator